MNNNDKETVTFAAATLSDRGLAGLTEKVNQLNKRAARHGMEPIALHIVRSLPFIPVIKWQKRRWIGVQETLHDVEVVGVPPRIEGWRLLARIEFNQTIGQVLRLAPGVEDDGSFVVYRTHTGHCDHCNTDRRRNDVFVLVGPDGSVEGRKVVGRNCLADFLRDGDAETLIRYGEMAEAILLACDGDGRDCEGFEYGGGNGSPTLTPRAYLTAVAMLIRRLGWVSRSQVKDMDDSMATADTARFYFNAPHNDKFMKWVEKNELSVNDRDVALAVAAIEWAKSVNPSSEYMHTIQRIAAAEWVDWKLDGYTASIIRAFQLHTEREAERAEKAASATQKVYIGEPKKRLRDVAVKVLRVRYIEGYYGTKTIVSMVAPVDGGVAPIVWFASGSQEFDEGAEYKLTATVKSHENQERWGKQTVVSRAKLVLAA